MISRPVEQIAVVLGAHSVGFPPTAAIQGIVLDSRDVKPGYLFVCIEGKKVDGHEYAKIAMRNGAVGVLAEKAVPVPHLLVDDIVNALANLARYYRSEFAGPVIGVTGSVGKSSTKEFVAAALAPLGDVLKSEGNRNTELSSPLTWTEMTPQHKSAVIEMSMRGHGQIRHLTTFSRPNIGIVTNIGHSHVEMVGDQTGIADAKGELLEELPKNGLAILWQDDPFLEYLKKKCECPVKTFGSTDTASCHITSYTALNWHESEFTGELAGEPFKAKQNVLGRHMAQNACAALLAAVHCGVKLEDAAEALHLAAMPPMRMEIKKLGPATVLIDTYNASPTSMIAAIESFSEMSVRGTRIGVFGEMRELGDFSETAHEKVAHAIVGSPLNLVILYGPMAHRMDEHLHGRIPVIKAESIEDIKSALKDVTEKDAILIKGSRGLLLEKVLET